MLKHKIKKLYKELDAIASNETQSSDQRLISLLDLGCQYFGLEIGIISHIVDDTYYVIKQCSPGTIPLADGARFNLPETYCAITLDAKSPVGIENVAKSNYRSHPAYIAFALESYLGVPIIIDNTVYGTLNFSSPLPHKKLFTDTDYDAITRMVVILKNILVQMNSHENIDMRSPETRSA